MSFFNPEIPIKEKPASHHPWERHIKDTYINTYKYGHNSAANPVYPPKKEKTQSSDRIKFTIIGNIRSREFIYSMKLVQGLHKYRSKSFDAPIIRGVTGTEWPKTWNDLKIKYGGLAFCLRTQCAVLINDRFLGGEEELKTLVESKYVYHLCPDYATEGLKLFANYLRSSGRPFVYLQISINAEVIGTMIFMLYSDLVPETCENFLRLCKTTKGGYSGTPIHRIIKDSWIQCGGFGLKETPLPCENFMVPHDRRGIIGMANAGRHVDCSTQFYVLLQPSSWMKNRFVAFGQLIDGEETLQKIEQVPCWYETPTKEITIFKAGVFTMECQDIMINRGANNYIHGHIDNLNTIGELFYEALMENVFLEAEFRRLQRIEDEMREGAEALSEEESKNLRTTQRFMVKKEEIDLKQQEKLPEKARRGPSGDRRSPVPVNNEFDVEVYQYEPEEYSYTHATKPPSESTVLPPEKPYYIPLTDVLYPGEVDSNFDIKRLLQGDYCLEADLEKHHLSNTKARHNSIPSEIFEFLFEKTPSIKSADEDSLDSTDEREIQTYLKINSDSVSFAGDVVRAMAQKDRRKPFAKTENKTFLSDEQLRRLRLAAEEYKAHQAKKVSLSLPTTNIETPKEIKRRQTGFVRPQDLDEIKQYKQEDGQPESDDDDDDDEDDYYKPLPPLNRP
ncbi:unnamed protein product [Chrysodeixis includens]|uniref:PPIase cyclophilin-type domain-containing protein n=1 Tax=Chrysodeixis includens TaxID=689277 RepID=A0A9P0FUK9_CHRIL|nr:unnamed protein product [Chrysodeixis includens]